MRYWIGLVVAVALVVSPLTVAAQETKTPEPWLESEVELFGLEGLHGTAGGTDAKASRPAFALIPQHLKERTPQYRHEQVRALYPEPEEPKPGLSRGAKIGLGIGIPVFVTGLAFMFGAIALSNTEMSSY
jgi:hypothetical protein